MIDYFFEQICSLLVFGQLRIGRVFVGFSSFRPVDSPEVPPYTIAAIIILAHKFIAVIIPQLD